MNIIGLGKAGCAIAETFKKYDQYNILCVDTKNTGYSNFLSVKLQNSHEEYEKNYKKLNLARYKGPTTLILSGAGKISGCVLRILEQLQGRPINVLYIKPNDFSNRSFTRDKIVFGVLQQYTRSDKIKKLYVIANKNIESIIGPVTIADYWNNINNVISSTYHMVNVFNNIEPILTNKSIGPPSCKIGTLGVVNYQTLKEKLFYNLQHPRTKNYFFGINSQTLETDKKMFSRIRDFVSSKKAENTDIGFSIFPTQYEENYVYSTHMSSFVQEQI